VRIEENTMTETLHDFQLSSQEADYLNGLAAHDESLARQLKSQQQVAGGRVELHLSRAEAERLRDSLTVKLAAIGFDENYSPNEQGRVLEKLIDRFYLR
jgi:hypothetical protein